LGYRNQAATAGRLGSWTGSANWAGTTSRPAPLPLPTARWPP